MEFTKTQIEKAIGDKFFEIYNKYNKSKIAIKRNWEQGKLNEPDLISNNWIWIEIFSNQYSQENKRQIEVNIKLWEPVVSSQVLIDSDQKACEFMLNKIQSKESKSYDFVWDIRLVVDCRDTPLTTMEDFKKFFDYNPIQKSRFK